MALQGIGVLNRVFMQLKRFMARIFMDFKGLLIVIIGVSSIGFTPSALAAKITDLYEAEIPVLSQSRAERRSAIEQALAEVLVRISGQQDIVLALPPLIETDAVPVAKTPNQPEQPALVLVGKTTEIAAALSKPTYYVKQFRYQKPTGKPHIDWGIKPPEENTNNVTKPIQQVLLIRFNKKKINKLLHDTGLPVWGKTRPSILVWIVVESRGKRYLLSTSIKSTTREAIEKHARLYGLPIRFPLMDLADRANISISDVWGNFEDRIMQASKRYQTESVLVGKLYIANRTWNTRWSLYVDDRRVDWEGQDIRLNQVVKQGLSYSAQNLSQAFADVKTEQGIQDILVEVKSLDNLTDYTQAEKYLSSISSVKKIQTVELERSRVLFRLTTQGSRVGVMQAISLGSQFAAEPNTVPKPDASIQVVNQSNQAEVATVNEDGVIIKVAKKKPEKLIPDLIYRLLK